MKITKEELLEGLAALDPANDADWTEEGLPVLERVQAATFDDTITRDDLTLHANGFNRANPSGGSANEKAAEVAQAAPAAEVDRPDPEGRRAELQADVNARKETISQLDAQLVELRRAREEASKEVDEAIKALEAEFPPIKPAHAIQDWLASEAQKRAERANQVFQVAAPKSPLDASLARSIGHGRGRKPQHLMAG